MTFGEKVQKLRTGRGLSQDQLAELLEVSRKSVSKWERDEAMPDTDKIIALSRIFGVTTDGLLTGEELPAPVEPERPHGERFRQVEDTLHMFEEYPQELMKRAGIARSTMGAARALARALRSALRR